MLAVSNVRADSSEQTFPTATPAQVDLFANAPAAVDEAGETATPTRTATPQGPVQIEAKEMANVRAQPDQNSERLGEIRSGEFYTVIRRYYRWIEFQFDAAPNHRGWVFDELVNIIGDPNAILVVESLDATAPPVEGFFASATGEAITQTPGGLLTATALARTPNPSSQSSITTSNRGAPFELTEEAAQALPTFTYPPGMVALAPTPRTEAPATPTEDRSALRAVETGHIPPIVPIVALGGLGLLGLLISAVRRG
jgi:hypothetical protein